MSKYKKIKKRMNLKIIVFGIVALSLIIGSVIIFAPTQGAGPTYFKFNIPTMPDGSRVHYSPGWFGQMDRVCKNTTVLYYNDKEGYGVAYTSDTFIPPSVSRISSTEADSIVKGAKDVTGIYAGQ